MARVALIGMLTALIALQIKEMKSEYAVYLGLAGSLLLVFLMLGKLKWMIQTLQDFFTYVPLDSVYLGMILKLVGISYLADFAAGICQEAGQTTLGKQIELFAKLTLFGISLPIVQSVFQTLSQL